MTGLHPWLDRGWARGSFRRRRRGGQVNQFPRPITGAQEERMKTAKAKERSTLAATGKSRCR